MRRDDVIENIIMATLGGAAVLCALAAWWLNGA